MLNKNKMATSNAKEDINVATATNVETNKLFYVNL